MQLRPYQERVVTAMRIHHKGQAILPTGAGKTLCMITDAQREFDTFPSNYTIVVVAPRILLAEQLSSEFLEFITNTRVMHVHSGETHHYSTTNPNKISQWYYQAPMSRRLIFTTYNSLQKIVDSGIRVDTIYFDEAHNSVRRNFFPATEHFSQVGGRCYFFTATRKTSATIAKPGMNDVEVYGNIIGRVSAKELVDGGFIAPPKVKIKKFEVLKAKQISADRDCGNVLETIDETHTKKILVCVKTTKQLINLMSQTDYARQLHSRGYSYLYITSKTGAVIDGQKVNREEFFNTLNTWGKDPSKKFVVLHRSILSEGISVSALETVIFLRNMDVIEMTQTIGRVLRTAPEKSFGLCVVPVYSNVGIATEKRLQGVIDTVFHQGKMMDSVIKR